MTEKEEKGYLERKKKICECKLDKICEQYESDIIDDIDCVLGIHSIWDDSFSENNLLISHKKSNEYFDTIRNKYYRNSEDGFNDTHQFITFCKEEKKVRNRDKIIDNLIDN